MPALRGLLEHLPGQDAHHLQVLVESSYAKQFASLGLSLALKLALRSLIQLFFSRTLQNRHPSGTPSLG